MRLSYFLASGFRSVIITYIQVISIPLVQTSKYLMVSKGLVTNYGGATKREGGGHVKFYPYKKWGGGFFFIHAEGGGGHKLFCGSFYTVA